jgi:hypothetical protein
VDLPAVDAVLVGATTKRTRMNLQTGEQQEPRIEAAIGAGTNLVQLEPPCKKTLQSLYLHTELLGLSLMATNAEETTSQQGEAVGADDPTPV